MSKCCCEVSISCTSDVYTVLTDLNQHLHISIYRLNKYKNSTTECRNSSKLLSSNTYLQKHVAELCKYVFVPLATQPHHTNTKNCILEQNKSDNLLCPLDYWRLGLNAAIQSLLVYHRRRLYLCNKCKHCSQINFWSRCECEWSCYCLSASAALAASQLLHVVNFAALCTSL